MPIISDAIQRLWPLSESYEYADWVGAQMRSGGPLKHLHHRFLSEGDAQVLYPSSQARDYAFLVWLEGEAPEDLREALPAVLREAPAAQQLEIQASLDCVSRDYTPRIYSGPLRDVSGQRARVYGLDNITGYPNHSSSYLDDWTARALRGAKLELVETGFASDADLQRVHDPLYLSGLWRQAAASESGHGDAWLSPETLVTREAEVACRAAAGAVIAAARDALSGVEGPHLAAVRPGSHHAGRARGGGTCLVNNLAVAAAWALEIGGAQRVAIIDIDAHHGNGTQEIFWDRGDVVTASIHQGPVFFPGTGAPLARGGDGDGSGANINVEVHVGSPWLEAALDLIHEVQQLEPDLILVEWSADAHRADAVSDLHASDGDFHQVATALLAGDAPVAFELGASSAERAWVGALRSLVQAASDVKSSRAR